MASSIEEPKRKRRKPKPTIMKLLSRISHDPSSRWVTSTVDYVFSWQRSTLKDSIEILNPFFMGIIRVKFEVVVRVMFI